MTIDEAIEGLKRIIDWPQSNLSPASAASARLGIEALKEKQQTRYASHRTEYDLLPGETEE